MVLYTTRNMFLLTADKRIAFRTNQQEHIIYVRQEEMFTTLTVRFHCASDGNVLPFFCESEQITAGRISKGVQINPIQSDEKERMR